MSPIILIPGLLGSELYETQGIGEKMWLDVGQIAKGNIGKMRIADDGFSPGPPDGVQLKYGSTIEHLWEKVLIGLDQQMRPLGYSVSSFPYDWRLAVRSHGPRLYDELLRQFNLGGPVTLVCHSMGGLVARAAWTLQVERGTQSMVRRIITLGTPHQGSYETVATFGADSPAIDGIVKMTGAVKIIGTIGGRPLYSIGWTYAGVAELVQSWPGLYDLLPVLDTPTADADPNRRLIFDSANWQSGNKPKQRWLDQARLATGPWLRDPASMPPPGILTTVAGEVYDTDDVLAYGQLLGKPNATYETWHGDGIVTVDSALVRDSARYTIVCSHVDLPAQTMRDGQLKAWIVDPRHNPDPSPPPVSVPGELQAVLSESPPWAEIDCKPQGYQ